MVEPSLAVTAGAHDRDQPRAERRRREKARKYGGLVSPSPIVPKGVAARASEGASARGKPDAQRRPTRSLSISVLGPLWVSAGGRPVSVTTSRLRALLVALALSADDEVSVGRLAGIIWDTTPPVHVRRATQVYVTRLRKLLGADAIVTSPAGYRLHVHPEQVDAILFERLVDAAAVGDPAAERAGLERALALWRGTPFDGVRSAWLESVESHRLTERYAAALERRIELDLDLGGSAELVAELLDLTARYPLRERLWGHLITALWRSGQQADALAAYQRLYRLLADELGIEPSHAVQALHRQILTGQAGTGRPSLSSSPLSASLPRTETAPRQLPADVAALVGRARELADLDRIPNADSLVITAIDGMAGVGKTALAVHIAHRLTGRYPDGQLFIDLHGYTQGIPPVEPADALDHLLRSLEVPAARIPPRIEERSALYRTRLADRRMLILLDNAATETQVEPLLPGARGCLVLVTSRHRLAGLDRTRVLSLDSLPVADAVSLFTRTAGENRLSDAPPDLLAELAELCGRLPLAIRIAAARLRSHPSWDLSHLIDRLRDQRRRLGELEAGERSVAAALDLSYQHLRIDQQQSYRLLGLHPGPDIDSYAAAALTGATVPEAGRLLEDLHGAHLLQEPVPGRFRFHDLTRAHAAHTATREETEPVRRAALDRLLDYYQHTASVATDAAYAYERERRPQVPPACTPSPALDDPVTALGWLNGELPNLLAAARHAAEHSRPAHLMHLSSILKRHLRTRGRYHDAVVLHEQALKPARTTCHRAAELDALTGIGHIHMRQGRPELATKYLRRALELARAQGRQGAEADALHTLGWVHLHTGQYGRAIDLFQRALHVTRAGNHDPGEVDSLNGLGHVIRLQGRPEPATSYLRRALTLARATGHRPGEQSALAGLGDVHRLRGRYEQAADVYWELLDLARGGEDRNWQFEAWQGLGRLRHTTGHPDTAVIHHHQALALANELGQPTDQARAHDGLAHARYAMRQLEEARKHWQQALDLLTELRVDHTDEKETTAATIQARLASR
jgi:DNA-binding SARP family transcriptional activator/Tfp pilus assembly protein PilF